MADVSAGHVHDNMLARDIALLRDSVQEAGALALSLFRTELRNWTKGASSPVSESDIAVNDLIQQQLRSARPDYGWLSEESADDETRLGKKLVWIVDPIDGTRGYLAGREDWCVSVALVENAAPLLAAVFVPASDEFFFAARGQEAVTARGGDSSFGSGSRWRPPNMGRVGAHSLRSHLSFLSAVARRDGAMSHSRIGMLPLSASPSCRSLARGS